MKTDFRTKIVFLVAISFVISGLIACGKDVIYTQAETPSFAVLDSLDSQKCDSQAEGTIVFVKSTSSMLACADGEWVQTNEFGAPSLDCRSIPLEDGQGFLVMCDEDTVGIIRNGEKGPAGDDGEDGKDGDNGKDGNAGKKGDDGVNCAAKAREDGDGYDVLCGDNVIGTLKNGTDGAAVTGPKGADCSGELLAGGEIQITCGDVVGTLKSGNKGDPGDDGEDCSIEARTDGTGFDMVCGGVPVGMLKNGNPGNDVTGPKGDACTGEVLENGNVKITCGDETYTLAGPQDGTGCTLEDDGEGTVTVRCPGDDVGKKFYKAVCGATPYDPANHACGDNNTLWNYCGSVAYNPETHICTEGDVLMSLCGLTYYNPGENTCIEIGTSVVKPLCGINTYDPENYSCCGTEIYNPTDHFCDNRDKQVYRFTVINIPENNYSETWMAENLNYRYLARTHMHDSSSFCYANISGYCKKYGRLYLWSAAVDSSGVEDPDGIGVGCGFKTNCTLGGTNGDDVRGICPEGWHLPKESEYRQMFVAVGGSLHNVDPLRSTSDWFDEQDNGTDDYHLTILPSGGTLINRTDVVPVYGEFCSLGAYARFWTSTTSSSYSVYLLVTRPSNGGAALQNINRGNAFAIRCIKDKDQ